MKFFLLFFIFLTGCTQPATAKWHADVRFTDDERAKIQEGISWLEENSHHDVGGVLFDYDSSKESPFEHTIRREYGNHTGTCSGSVIRLWPESVPEINMVWDPAYLPGLSAHEMAHCELGFKDDYHDNYVGPGIMGRVLPMEWSEHEEEQAKSQKTH